MASKRLPILRVLQAGTPQFERYLIEDQNERVWTGERFSSSEGAALYAIYNDAAIDIHNILKGHFQGVEPMRFVVPLVVEVFSYEPIHVAEVARHLSRASRLHLNVAEHGNGPRNSLVLPTIEWHRIEVMKETKSE